MQFQSENIIPLKKQPSTNEFLDDVCEQLNQLTCEYIHPLIESLLPDLISQINDCLETATNNQDIMRLMEIQNSLKKNTKVITSTFIKKSIITDNKDHDQNKKEEHNSELMLLDNNDLDHQLLWTSAAEKMAKADNIQCLFRIKNRFEHAFPDYCGLIPTLPEKLCESFSFAVASISVDADIEQLLLGTFIQHIQQEAEKLWTETDQLLEMAGLEIKTVAKQPSVDFAPKAMNTDNSAISSENTPSDQAFQQENLSSQFMDSLANKLVTRVENMLIQEEIIPQSKVHQVRSIDLASILTTLQIEIMQHHESITCLAESIKSTLTERGDGDKLSQRHEDLINLVGMLFEFILDDHQLPSEIKKSIGLLQIPVLKLAILDNEFLMERHHPARDLLNEMTFAGMQCQEDLSFDPIYLLIESTVRAIIAGSTDNPDIFQESLENFRRELTLIQSSGTSQNEHSLENPLFEEIVPFPDKETKEQVNEPADASSSLSTEDTENTEEQINEQTHTSDPVSMNETEFETEEEIILENTGLTSFAGENEHEIDATTKTEAKPEPDDLFNGEDPESDEQYAYMPIEGLKTGQWVEFVGEGDSHRLSCKLAHINQDKNRYLFVNRSGMRVAEWDGHQLSKGIANNSIIIHENTQIFDRALSAVMGKFKRR